MSARIWLDITGIRPGSDAAVFAVWLGSALAQRPGITLQLCRREPGMTALEWPDLAELLGRSAPPRRARLPRLNPLRALAQRLPDRPRTAIGRFVRLQRAALFAWRAAGARALQSLPRRPARDRATPSPGEVLLMLVPAGSAARFAETGVRLAFIAADATALTRPDWMEAEAAAAAATWLRSTLPHISTVIAFSQACAEALEQTGCLPRPVVVEAAACLGAPVGPPIVPDRPFVLVTGEIGEAGQTRHLLLAWRRLLDEMPQGDVPLLVLACSVGALVGDVLEQLRNSRLLDGHVRLLLHPTPDQTRPLLRDCLFTIAPAGRVAWGRGAWDSLAAGRPCLSAFPAPGTVPIDPTNARELATIVRSWTARAPAAPPPPPRDWDDVAGDVLAALQLP